jgi:hypothetical protein
VLREASGPREVDGLYSHFAVPLPWNGMARAPGGVDAGVRRRGPEVSRPGSDAYMRI